MGGLPVPRDPSEIVNGKVITNKGWSVDREFRIGAAKALEIIKKQGMNLVILQSRSPSCGLGRIYDGSFSGKLINADGIFARLLKNEGIRVIDVKEFIDD